MAPHQKKASPCCCINICCLPEIVTNYARKYSNIPACVKVNTSGIHTVDMSHVDITYYGSYLECIRGGMHSPKVLS